MATVFLDTTPAVQAHSQARSAAHSTPAFALAAISMVIVSCFLAGWAPLGFSIVTVFLFAGPHNWLEARYMLTRMPARWGPLAIYFSLGIAGVVGLALSMVALHWLAEWLGLSEAAYLTLVACWNTALVAWITVLGMLRSRQNPRRNWSWLAPLAFLLIALNWLRPLSWSLALVYLHPLVALWFLDREIGRMQPVWRSAYRGCLLLVPVGMAALWWKLAGSADLPGNDWLSQQITGHAGGNLIRSVSTHFLVSAHTFLEMLHYGVWIIAIPLISVRAAPWQLDNVPLARHSKLWRWTIMGAIAMGAIIMVALWLGFLADYPLTRDIYFTVAIFHVLAEVPFLLRLL
jgi:hypothetical protein